MYRFYTIKDYNNNEICEPFIVFEEIFTDDSKLHELFKSIILEFDDELRSYDFDALTYNSGITEIATFKNNSYYTQGVQSEIEGPTFYGREVEKVECRVVCKQENSTFVYECYNVYSDIVNTFLDIKKAQLLRFDFIESSGSITVIDKKTKRKYDIIT